MMTANAQHGSFAKKEQRIRMSQATSLAATIQPRTVRRRKKFLKLSEPSAGRSLEIRKISSTGPLILILRIQIQKIQRLVGVAIFFSPTRKMTIIVSIAASLNMVLGIMDHPMQKSSRKVDDSHGR